MLFFTLLIFYSFGVKIINNNPIGIERYLGDFIQSSGENTFFRNSFEIHFFIQENKKITINPII